MTDERAVRETKAIPEALRRAVDDRDGGFCRMCGKYVGERRAIHHIFYGGDAQGMGGRRLHTLDNLISLCWLPFDNDCHQKAHSKKHIWQPLLAEVVIRSGNATALQLARWFRK
jgi:5-methylcytosine-specific restriction endonuclease McrA